MVIPVWNAATTVLAALRTVRWQTLEDWEAVVVDDGSTDGSLELLRALAAKEARIRLLARPHRGLVAALQEGLLESRAPLVARMDADDLCRPDRLQRQADFLDRHPGIAVVGSGVRIFPVATCTAGMARYQTWLNSLWASEDLERDLFVESPLVHPSVSFRRAEILAAGGYRESRGPEDYDLWLRLWERGGRFGKVPQTLLFWRDTPSRVTRTDPRCHRDRFRELKVEALLRTRLATAQTLLLWGAGLNGKGFARDLAARGMAIEAFVDSHPAAGDSGSPDLPVLGPDQLPAPGGAFLLSTVGHPQSRAEIRMHLETRGWREGRDFLCVA